MTLNRSLSLSQMPTAEEQKSSEGNKIVKHFSCEQISFSGDQVKLQRMVQEFSVSNDNVKTLKSWAFNFEGPFSALNKKMPEVNESTDTTAVTSLEKKNKPKKAKKEIGMVRPLIKEQQQFISEKKSSRNILWIALPIIVVFAAVFALSSMQLASYRRICERKVNVQELKFILQRSVHGQESAINEITTELSAFSNIQETQIKILAFVGGIGVGKSYTASIISTNFMWDSNIQAFVMPVHRSLSAEEISAKFSLCGDNLVVLDDLKPKDTEIVADFLKDLVKYNNMMGTKLIIVLVFTTQYQDSDEIGSIFQIARLPVVMIEFQPIEQEIVEMCIEESLFQKGVTWSENDVKKVLELLPEDTGCKGVSSKVNIVIAPETV